MNNANKRSGVLLHPTALPGPHGIGDLGPSAYRFIDDLQEMNQSLWQILPLGPTDISNSPYSSTSTFAGNHLLISLDMLIEDQLLDPEEDVYEFNSKVVEFNNVTRYKYSVLSTVCDNFESKASESIKLDFSIFCDDNSYWLDDYSKYWALKIQNNMSQWIEWNNDEIFDSKLVNEGKIIQFLFDYQWKRLHQYCLEREIRIIGDMPIYVSYDSADVFFNRDLFQLDNSGQMLYQAGCPPCEYQKKGQLWGNPLYNWEYHENTDFDWWIKRFKKIFQMVDIVRLDHFIGYIKYYKIPMGNSSATSGHWMEAPGEKLFEKLFSEFNDLNVFAEDLGDITKEVIDFRDTLSIPGTRVLQFDLEDIQTKKSFQKNSVLYTGTHDNDTLRGWVLSLPIEHSNNHILCQRKLLNYFDCDLNDIHWKIIEYAMASVSNFVVIPLQDILEKDSEARFNTPGTMSSRNWSWRTTADKIDDHIKSKLINLSLIHSRTINKEN